MEDFRTGNVECRDDLADHHQPAQGRDAARRGRRHQARRGRDRLVRHLDDQLQDEEPGLRVRLHRPPDVARDQRQDRRVVRRGARELEGVRPDRGRTTARSSTPTTTPSGRTSGTGRPRRPTASTAGPMSSARTSTTGSRPGPRSRADHRTDPARKLDPGFPAWTPGRRVPGHVTTTPRPTADARSRPTPSVRRRVAAWLHRHPRVRLALLLALPLAWLGVVYLGSLVLLFLNAFWSARPVHRRWSSASSRSTTSSSS